MRTVIRQRTTANCSNASSKTGANNGTPTSRSTTCNSPTSPAEEKTTPTGSTCKTKCADSSTTVTRKQDTSAWPRSTTSDTRPISTLKIKKTSANASHAGHSTRTTARKTSSSQAHSTNPTRSTMALSKSPSTTPRDSKLATENRPAPLKSPVPTDNGKPPKQKSPETKSSSAARA